MTQINNNSLQLLKFQRGKNSVKRLFSTKCLNNVSFPQNKKERNWRSTISHHICEPQRQAARCAGINGKFQMKTTAFILISVSWSARFLLMSSQYIAYGLGTIK